MCLPGKAIIIWKLAYNWKEYYYVLLLFPVGLYKKIVLLIEDLNKRELLRLYFQTLKGEKKLKSQSSLTEVNMYGLAK